MRIKKKLNPFVPTSLNILKNRSQTRKKMNNTIREEIEEGELKNRARN
jgi:hypothetical protein